MNIIELYDIACFLDENNIIKNFEFEDKTYKNMYGSILNEYIGKKITDFFDMNKTNGYIIWKEQKFQYAQIKNKLGSGSLILMTRKLDELKIYKETLQCLNEGVQIYDRNGNLMFLNKACKKAERINLKNVVGKYLLDIYNFDESDNDSTILTTLKQESPTLNRCARFKLSNSEDVIVSMNSGVPLFEDNELIGAVVIEHDQSILKELSAKCDVLEQYIEKQNKNNNIQNKKKSCTFNDLIGETDIFKEVIQLAKKIAVKDCSVLICGETGTGKELFAQSIHSLSKRRKKGFIAINCAAIPENLIEGILFGTVKGAFTGSINRIGIFEQAEGGTLFLDEINSMSLNMQMKLLRVIEEGKVRRVGGLNDIDCNVRIISSCNEDPFDVIKDNRLRKDLFFRLSTVTLDLPTLKERKEDIIILAEWFIQKLYEKYFKKVKKVSDKVTKILKKYSWPGNIRELFHVLEYAFNVMDGDIMEIDHLPKYLKLVEYDSVIDKDRDCKMILQNKTTLSNLLEQYEKNVVEEVLADNNNNVTKAAKALGIKRESLYYRIKKYSI